MNDKFTIWLCTILGFISGAALMVFASVQSGMTLQLWMDELFLHPLWTSWVELVAVLAASTALGVRRGFHVESFWGVLLTPVLCVLAAFGMLALIAVTYLIMEHIAVVGFLAFFVFIGILMSLAGGTTLIIVLIRK